MRVLLCLALCLWIEPLHAERLKTSWYRAHRANGIASNQYPIGTRLHLYNKATGRQAIGVVEGTGPFVAGVGLDVARQLADLLGFRARGHAYLTVTRMGK